MKVDKLGEERLTGSSELGKLKLCNLIYLQEAEVWSVRNWLEFWSSQDKPSVLLFVMLGVTKPLSSLGHFNLHNKSTSRQRSTVPLATETSWEELASVQDCLCE